MRKYILSFVKCKYIDLVCATRSFKVCWSSEVSSLRVLKHEILVIRDSYALEIKAQKNMFDIQNPTPVEIEMMK